MSYFSAQFRAFCGLMPLLGDSTFQAPKISVFHFFGIELDAIALGRPFIGGPYRLIGGIQGGGDMAVDLDIATVGLFPKDEGESSVWSFPYIKFLLKRNFYQMKDRLKTGVVGFKKICRKSAM